MTLSPEARAVIDEEEALYARVRACLRQAISNAPRRGGAADRAADRVEALRSAREEAREAAADDLPPLLLEMSVRRRLLDMTVEPELPDPDAPYLAHLRVDEGHGKKDYLLGRASHLDPS